MKDRLELAREWIREALGVASVDLQPASMDASFRRYFRVRTTDTSLVLMDAPPEKENCRPYVAVGDLLAEAGVHVPEIHARNLESGFLLLEDLGTRCYMDELDSGSADALYADAIDSLIAMQRGVPANAVPDYDQTLVMEELSLFEDWFLGRHLGIDSGGRTGEILDSSFRFLAREFDAQEKVFVHRDYHSRNLMRTSERNPGVLDFQDAVSGPAVYDVISLLRDVYVEWPAERVQAWMNDYRSQALANGIPAPPDADTFLRAADLVGAQRHLKIAGIFCRLYYRDGKSDYLSDIPLTLRYLLGECERHSELTALRSLLEELDVMTRSAEETERLLDDRAGGVR